MKNLFLGFLAILLLVVVVFGGCAQPALAPKPAPAPTPAKPSESVADFYKGKTFTIKCTSAPGSGTDLIARTALPFLSKLMGVDAIVVNETAAAGLVTINSLYSSVKPDGLTILCLPLSEMLETWAYDAPGIQYDPVKFGYLGSTIGGLFSLYVAPKGPYSSLADLQQVKRPLRFGSNSPAATPSLAAIIAIETLGFDGIIATGYAASAARNLAMNQGELDADNAPIETALNYEKKGTAKVLLLLDDERDKFFPEYPCLSDVTKLSERHKTLINGIVLTDKCWITPPGLPNDRLKFLQDSFSTVLNDKEFQASFAKQFDVWRGGRSAKELTDYVLATVKNKSSFAPLFTDLIKKYVK